MALLSHPVRNQLSILELHDTAAIEILYNGTAVTGNRVSATEVGVYELEVRLKDAANYGWAPSSPTKLEFEVTKGEVELGIVDSEGGTSLSGAQGRRLKAYLEVNPNKSPHAVGHSHRKRILSSVIYKRVERYVGLFHLCVFELPAQRLIVCI